MGTCLLRATSQLTLGGLCLHDLRVTSLQASCRSSVEHFVSLCFHSSLTPSAALGLCCALAFSRGSGAEPLWLWGFSEVGSAALRRGGTWAVAQAQGSSRPRLEPDVPSTGPRGGPSGAHFTRMLNVQMKLAGLLTLRPSVSADCPQR